MKRITINTHNYNAVYNDYKNRTMKLKDICVKYNIKSKQTIYNIIKYIDNTKNELETANIIVKPTNNITQTIKPIRHVIKSKKK